MQAADLPDGPETDEAKALLGEGIKNCRKIITNYRLVLMPDAPPIEDDSEAAGGAPKP